MGHEVVRLDETAGHGAVRQQEHALAFVDPRRVRHPRHDVEQLASPQHRHVADRISLARRHHAGVIEVREGQASGGSELGDEVEAAHRQGVELLVFDDPLERTLEVGGFADRGRLDARRLGCGQDLERQRVAGTGRVLGAEPVEGNVDEMRSPRRLDGLGIRGAGHEPVGRSPHDSNAGRPEPGVSLDIAHCGVDRSEAGGITLPAEIEDAAAASELTDAPQGLQGRGEGVLRRVRDQQERFIGSAPLLPNVEDLSLGASGEDEEQQRRLVRRGPIHDLAAEGFELLRVIGDDVRQRLFQVKGQRHIPGG